MRVYLAGPMTGIPHFNRPAFDAAAKKLRAEGHTVFNPVDRDVFLYGPEMFGSNPTGDGAQAALEHGFNRREALGADVAWICREAEVVALLPGWNNSSGALAEATLAVALKLGIIEL